MLDAVNVGGRLINLINGHQKRNFSRLNDTISFDGLRLDAIVGRYYQDSDVSDLGAAAAHSSKSFMTGSINKSQGSVLADNLVGTNVLGDAARFTGHDVSAADRI